MIPFLDTYWPFIWAATGFITIVIHKMTDADKVFETGLFILFLFSPFVLPMQLILIFFKSAVHAGNRAKKELGDDHFLTK